MNNRPHFAQRDRDVTCCGRLNTWLLSVLLFCSLTQGALAETPQRLALLDCERAQTPLLQGALPVPVVDIQPAINALLDAADRGELVIYGVTLNSSQLEPRQVEYLFPVSHPIPQIKVTAAVKPRIALPGAPDVTVKAICAHLDRHGAITEVDIHCSAESN